MKRTSRNSRTVALLLAAVVAPAAMPVISSAGADTAAPRVLSVSLDPPAVVGRTAELRVVGVAKDAPVSGMVVRFGLGSTVGLSACSINSDGSQEAPFAPGSRARLTTPHVFDRAGTRVVLVRLDSGGCAAAGKSGYQPVAVTPTRRGQRPVQPTVLPAPLPGPGVPPLDGVDDLPPTGLASLPALPASTQRCAGASKRVARSARSLREARRALLCLLNAQRRAHGLRSLRANSRLRRAATAHSKAMVRRRFFSHVQPGGVGLASRLRRTHYITPNLVWRVGENIGFGRGASSKPSWMIRAWMRSTLHRAVILQPRYREVGLGIVNGVPGRSRARGATFTADFGVRR